MILYLDSSPLVKLFVAERSSETVHDLVHKADVVTTSRVAYPEACAAFARRWRDGRLSQHEYSAAREALKDQWKDFGAVELAELHAGELTMKHSLRGFDSVHLAAVLEVRDQAAGIPLIFCTFDTFQAAAARAEQLTVVPEDGANRANRDQFHGRKPKGASRH